MTKLVGLNVLAAGIVNSFFKFELLSVVKMFINLKSEVSQQLLSILL